MILKKIIQNKTPLFWLLFHIGLGALSTVSSFPLIGWFYLVLAISIPFVLKKSKVDDGLAFFIVYLVSFEILARMSKASPFIPYESGKYLLFSSLLFGIFKGFNKGKIGLFLSMLLVPAMFFDQSGEVGRLDLVFNVLGPINVGLAIAYFSKQRFTLDGFQSLLRMGTYPLLGALVFVFFKTPDYQDIQFTLGATTKTTGGFGSNQVSTAFGLGMLFMFVFLINRWSFSGKRYLDELILLGFAFQGLLSFSRGGMIGGAIGILVILFFVVRMKTSEKRNFNLPKLGKYLIPGVIILVLSFWFANNISGGLLLLRYQGETQGTLMGVRDKDLNLLTTGRLDIFQSDVEIFYDNFLTGVGVGASSRIRSGGFEIVSAHVELSRLLAEHGLLGLIYFLLLILIMFYPLRREKNPLFKAILFSFAVIAVYSTFHAATRTYITPLLMGLSTIYIVYGQGSLSRK